MLGFDLHAYNIAFWDIFRIYSLGNVSERLQLRNIVRAGGGVLRIEC